MPNFVQKIQLVFNIISGNCNNLLSHFQLVVADKVLLIFFKATRKTIR